MNRDREESKFLIFKRWSAGISGIAVLVLSVLFSKMGFGEGVPDEYKWVGYVLALAVTSCQLMVTSSFSTLNVTIFFLGLAAYGYSISTNVSGFYIFRGMEYVKWNGDYLNLFGGAFMDIYPEMAIGWALKESKVGDLFGNWVKAWNNPESLIENEKSYIQAEFAGNTRNLNTQKPNYSHTSPSNRRQTESRDEREKRFEALRRHQTKADQQEPPVKIFNSDTNGR